MRILHVIDGLPFPLTTGRLRHYFLLRELAARHEVTLLALTDGTETAADVAALGEVAREVETFAAPGGAGGPVGAVRRIAGSLAGRPAGPVGALRDRVRAGLATGSFDAALLNGKRTYLLAGDLAAVPTVADLCDAASARAWARLRYTTPAGRPRVLVQWAELRLLERRVLAAADRLVFATPRDRAAIVDGHVERATVVPNGIDTVAWSRRSPTRPTDAIVFTGAMDYGPNADAALHLVRDILPLVRAAEPAARLSLVGRDPAPALVAAGDRAGVTVTGFVDDMRPYLEGATVFAAPIRYGAGIQNKVLEAMAMGVPVVASSSVVDGLRTDDGEEPPVVVADAPAAVAARLVDALRAARADPAPHDAGRAYVARHFVWERAGRALEATLEAAVADRRYVNRRGRS